MNEPPRYRFDYCSRCCGEGGFEVSSGDWLRWKRTQARISLREMARRLKLSAPYLSDVERERRRGNERIEKAYERL